MTAPASASAASLALGRLVRALDAAERCAESPEGDCVKRADAFTGKHGAAIENALRAARVVLKYQPQTPN